MADQSVELPAQFIEGVQVNPMYDPDIFRSAIKYKPQSDDVFIATYPKCGTTWTQHILLFVFRQGEPLESQMMFFTNAPVLEIAGGKVAESMPRPVAFKTHLPLGLIPWSDEAKYIYITRNPKDCCVSYYHHVKSTPHHDIKGFLTTCIEYFGFTKCLLCSYIRRKKLDLRIRYIMYVSEKERVLKKQPECPFHDYEEMKEDPEAAILKMASFIDEEKFAKPLKHDPEKLKNVLEYSSFKHMKEVFNKSIGDLFKMSAEGIDKLGLPEEVKKVFAKLKENAPPADTLPPMNFVRKGIIGDWKNYFSEEQSAKAAETMPRPGALKIHLPFHLTPWSDKAKYIYVTRNPKDCCVSYYHHMKNIPGHGFKGTFDQFFELFISGKIDYGDYFDHLMGWYEHRNDSNVLFLTYEQMKENPEASVLKLASFIDEEKFAKPLREDPEKLQNVLKYSSFKHMKESFNKGMDELFTMSPEEIMKSDLPETMKKMLAATEQQSKEKPTGINFIRKGITGDWKNYFNEDQSRRMDEKFAERTKGTDLPDLWKNYM
ncbi:Sulfotransferase 1C2A like protein [Argiope bruennichi]|uniref:Sulfotransferase 1C2A like protein n=1 Tax=Argiope bruennichi TaxID=94029 RepID=A0A8T0E9G3_ARGBR|nr:Sulfotransferase 1C2A like protein [Argiope bruennichi]